MNRRLVCALAVVLSMSSLADAADRDDRITTLVVNFTAGGPLDVAARVVAEKLRASLGQNVIVDNKAGASGNIGAAYVAKAAADGQTILFTTDMPVVTGPLIFPSMPFKSQDLRAVALIGSVPSAIAVNTTSGLHDLADLIRKGKQGPMSFSSSGAGSPAHIGSAMLAQNAGIQVNHIPYKGGGPAALALAAGEVDAGVLAVPGILAFVKDGRVRPLAVTSARRSSQFPDIPTTTELGFPDIQTDLLFLVMVPAKTPEVTVQKLQTALTAALADPAVKEKLAGFGIEQTGRSDAAAANTAINALRTRYAKIVKQAGIRVE